MLAVSFLSRRLRLRCMFPFKIKMACLTRKRKPIFIRLCVDIACIAIVAAGTLSIKFGAKPYRRGFFCDDESIKHPVQNDTVTVTMAVLVGLIVPIFLIVSVEAMFRKSNQVGVFSQHPIYLRRKSWLLSTYNTILVFIFGMGVSQLLTEIGKYSIGRLRPHFLTLCAPDFSKIDCTKGYITEYTCTSTDTAKMDEVRLSFPSGHSSFAMYCMLFPVLYLQSRLSCKVAPLLKPTVQVILLSLGIYTCLSRISDYKHHWSDVLAGGLLGAVVCVAIVRSLTDFGKLLFVPRFVSDNQEMDSLPVVQPKPADLYGRHSPQTSIDSEERLKTISVRVNTREDNVRM